jgi:hypothetical protein
VCRAFTSRSGRTNYWDARLRARLLCGELADLQEFRLAEDNIFSSEWHPTIVGLKGRSRLC